MKVGGTIYKCDMLFNLVYEVILYEWIPRRCNKNKKHLMNQIPLDSYTQ